MKTYNKFLLENVYNDNLSYYAFDWDDNILMMDTVLYLDKMVNGEWVTVNVSTSDFTHIRKYIMQWKENEESVDNLWRYKNGDPEQTYIEFRDYGTRGKNAFLSDVISSIRKNNFGPSWDKFIECLISGSIFAIITARGHEPETIRNAVKWIIYNFLNISQKKELENNLKKFNTLFNIENKNKKFNQLVDKYLDLCDFVGISSSYFRHKYKYLGQTLNPEYGKKIVLKEFVKRITEYGKIINKKVNIGFSDDDKSTVEHIHTFIKNELSLDFPIGYHIYYTKDGIQKIPF